MSEEISSISTLNRLLPKKQVSMESLSQVKELTPSQEMMQVEQMKLQVDHAFSLMHEVRQRIESAYQNL